MGTNVIDQGPFTLNSGATLESAHINGIKGNLATLRVITLDAGANYIFDGIATQSTGFKFPTKAGTVNNITINNSMGVALDTSVTVNGALTLNGGNIITGVNTLAIGETGSVVRTSGYIVGNLKKNVATGLTTSRTFEIGDATNYTPVTVDFSNVTTQGNLTSSTTIPGAPPEVASGIDQTKYLNRVWAITNSGVGFDNCNATFTFVNPGDLQGGADPGNFIIAKKDAGFWSKPTVGTKGSTSIQATGMTSFSDFAVGEVAVPTYTLTVVAVNGTVAKNPPTGPYNDGT